MSRSANPARIGLFVLVGTFLAVATVIYVGSVRLFASDPTFLLYFKESVNGLTVGSPVKFKGVTIGNVSEIRLSYNQDRSVEGSQIPVFIKINEDKVRVEGNGAGQVDLTRWSDFSEEIRRGLRGRLQLESFITGQLFIELDYFARPGEPYRIVQKNVEYREIPTSPSVMAEIGSSAAEVLAQIGALDVQGINERVMTLLDRLNTTIEQMEPEQWNASIVQVGDSVERALAEVDLKPTVDRLNLVLDDLHRLTQTLDQSLDPALSDYHRIVEELSATLRRSQVVMGNLEQLTSPGAQLQQELSAAFSEIRWAARSARELMNYLERNPQSLLSGRAERP